MSDMRQFVATPTVEELEAEIERLNKRHDDFLQEFWATNAENAKLQAVVDAVKENGKIDPYFPHTKVGMMIAALEDDT